MMLSIIDVVLVMKDDVLVNIGELSGAKFFIT